MNNQNIRLIKGKTHYLSNSFFSSYLNNYDISIFLINLFCFFEEEDFFLNKKDSVDSKKYCLIIENTIKNITKNNSESELDNIFNKLKIKNSKIKSLIDFYKKPTDEISILDSFKVFIVKKEIEFELNSILNNKIKKEHIVNITSYNKLLNLNTKIHLFKKENNKDLIDDIFKIVNYYLKNKSNYSYQSVIVINNINKLFSLIETVKNIIDFASKLDIDISEEDFNENKKISKILYNVINDIKINNSFINFDLENTKSLINDNRFNKLESIYGKEKVSNILCELIKFDIISDDDKIKFFINYKKIIKEKEMSLLVKEKTYISKRPKI